MAFFISANTFALKMPVSVRTGMVVMAMRHLGRFLFGGNPLKTTHEKIMEVCLNIEALDSESLWDVYSYVQGRLVLLERYSSQKVPREKCKIVLFPVKKVAS